MATRPSVVARAALFAALVIAPALAAPAPSVPAVERSRLENGLTLVVESDPRVPLVGVHLSIGVGTADESPGNHGISHLVEHLVMSGPAGGPWVVAQVEQAGGHLNAGTMPDFTRFYLEVPAEHLRAAVLALAAAVQHPASNADDLERERRVVLDEIARRRADPAEEVQRAIAGTTDPSHPYHLTPEGTPGVVLGLSADAALGWHTRWYRPANASLVLVGDVRPDAARALTAEAFKDWRGDAPARAAEPAPQWEGWTEARIPREGPLATVALAFPAPAARDFRDSVLADVLVALLGRGASSRLATRLQAERNWATSVLVGYPTQRLPGRLTLAAECAPDRLADVRAVLLEEVARLRAYPVSDGELAVARARLRLEWLQSNQTVEQRAATLGYYEGTGAGVGAGQAAEFFDTLNTMTPAALQLCAQLWLAEDHGALVIVAPASVLATLPPAGDIAAAGPWERPVARVESVASWGRAPAIAPVSHSVLPTGLRLLVAPVSGARLATAEVLVAWPATEPRADPAARLLLLHSLGRGTTRYSGASIAAALDALGASLELRSSDDFLEMAVTAPVDTLPLATTFLAEMVMHPAFASEEIDHVRTRLRGVSVQVSRDPYARALDEVRTALFPPPVVPQWPAPEAFDGIDRDELLRLHRRLFRPARLIVVVTGDVAPDLVMRAVTPMFDGPQSESPWSPEFVRPPEPAPGQIQRTVRLDWPRAALLMGWIGPAPDAADVRAFEVLTTVVGGGLNSRWFRAVRQAGGLAYDVFAQTESAGGQSLCSVYLTTDPARLSAAERAVLDEVRRLSETPPGADEIERAKRLLVAQRLDALQVPAVYASLLARGALYRALPASAADYRRQLDGVAADGFKPLVARFLSRVAICRVLSAAQDNAPPGGVSQ